MSILQIIGIDASRVAELTGSNNANAQQRTDAALQSKTNASHNRSMTIKRLLARWAAGGTVIIGGVTQTAASMFQHEIVAAVIIAEAGAEGHKGMMAIREVIATRARERKLTETHVVLEPKQFSCLNNTTADELIRQARKHKNWKMVFGMVIEPPTTNYTRGANHYLNPAKLKKLPKWASDRKWTTTIRNHKFYKL